MSCNHYLPANCRSRKTTWRTLLFLPLLGLLSFSCRAAFAASPAPMPPDPKNKVFANDKNLHLKLAALLRQANGPNRASAPAVTAVTGTRGVLVLMVDFSDKVGNINDTHTFYNNLLFSTGNTPARSFSEFYKEASYNQFSIFGQVNGTNIPEWFRAPQPYSYYVGNDYGMGPYPNNSQKLVEDLIALANPYVDFSQFDKNGDGYVDGLMIIHAGIGAEASAKTTDMWSHQWSLNSPVTVDGVKIEDYSVQPEYVRALGDSSIGVFCHEFGHVLGLPDLYDTDSSSEGLGNWSLMASGSWNGPNNDGSSPAHLDAWSKIQLGWVTPTTVTSNITGATIPQVETSPTVYKLANSTLPATEYFLVENRAKTGFDTYLPSAGLCIYHVDDRQTTNTHEWYPTHTASGHYWVALDQADGLWELEKNLNRGNAGDVWPGSSGKLAFNNTTNPTTKNYAGTATNIAVQNISSAAATMTADLIVGSGGGSSDLTWADLWNGTAKLELTDTAIGSAFSFHFPSLLQEGSQIWAYYIKTNTGGKMAIGRAHSTDGVSWTDDGLALDVGASGAWDSGMASFPGIYKYNGVYYLVYEGSSGNSQWPGDIGLATSTDGLHFTKSGTGPILTHNSSGWEAANIGTPSLYRLNGVWYLFYHGFDGTDCQVGVATGTDLTNLAKYSQNPIIPTSATGWDSGTVGRRSQPIKVGDYYYMAWEGCNDKTGSGFGNCNWSTGLARSADLLSWEKYPNNPVVPIIAGTFGNDGPETFIINGATYLYVRKSPTDRYKIVAKAPVDHTLSVSASASPQSIASSGVTQLGAEAIDSAGDNIASWSWSDNGAGGIFSPGANVQNPAWTAPVNNTGSLAGQKLTVTATCAGSPALSAQDDVYIIEDSTAHYLSISASATPGVVASGGATTLRATASDTAHHSIATWLWSDNGAGGVFSPGADTQNPSYTAPGNNSGSAATRTLTVTATCSASLAAINSASVALVENSNAHTVTVTASADPSNIASEGETQLSASAEDNYGHNIAGWSWSDHGAGGVFTPSADVQNPIYTGPGNSSQTPAQRHLSVTATCDGASVQSGTAEVYVWEGSLPNSSFDFPVAGKYLFSLPLKNPDRTDGRWVLRDLLSDPDAVVTHTDPGTGDPIQIATWSAVAQAYTYGTLDDLLSPGQGYFLEVTDPCSLSLTGVAFELYSYVQAEWNLLGAPSIAVDFRNLASTGQPLSGPWAWNTALQDYEQSYLLEPGQGYWVKFASAGTVGVPPAETAARLNSAATLQSGEKPYLANASTLMEFSDVPARHWAHAGAQLMRWLAITGGWNNDNALNKTGKVTPAKKTTGFKPGGNITRGQLAVFLCRAFDLPLSPAPQLKYSDIPADYWGAGYIEAVSSLGIMGEYPGKPGCFCLKQKVTRAELAAALARAGGLPLVEPASQVFSDVPAYHWAASEIAALSAQGAFQGEPGIGPNFKPDKAATRAELALYLYHLLNSEVK